jgi:hypothetical protein
MAQDAADLKLDGNAAAGLLGALFPGDLTLAQGCCAGCGAVKPFAELAVYGGAVGLVVRCPGCDAVLLRVAQSGSRYWLDLRGFVWLQLDDAPQA